MSTDQPGRSDVSGEVEALAEVMGEVRVAGAREADWWTNDEDHLLIQVLKAECVLWAEGLLASDWLAAYVAAEQGRAVREAGAKALEDAADAIEPGNHDCFKMMCPHCATRKANESRQRWLRARAAALRTALPDEPEGKP